VSFLAVASGGAFGALARYLAAGWVQSATGDFFPWGTLAVNVVGSAALGFLMTWLESSVTSPEVRQLITIGFLGSFTTFSTFSFEAVAMLRDGEWWRAGGYVAGSVVLALLAVGMGAAVASALLRR
jgi:fluoride exporter